MEESRTMKQSEYLEIGKDVVMRNVGRLPLVLSKAKGSRVWDTDGKEYIDFLMGISVNNFGHCHPAISEAIASQAQKIVHVSNYFYLEEQVEVASELVKLSGYQQVFFSNSGAEANEAAIKLARKFGKVMAAPWVPFLPRVSPNTRNTSSPSCQASPTPNSITWIPGKPPSPRTPSPSWWNWSRAKAA
jgi:acetylornithine/succinyldiaminopimelate/putrescine aminotransferase